MTIYVTMVKDRHTETEAHLFSTAEKAIFFAREYLKGQADSAADVEPEDATISEEALAASGWLFYTCYSTEGDCVWVLPREVDESFFFRENVGKTALCGDITGREQSTRPERNLRWKQIFPTTS